MFRTRFCPITARPIKPISQLPLSIKLLQIACPVDASVFCSRTSISPIDFLRSGAALGGEGFRGGNEVGSRLCNDLRIQRISLPHFGGGDYTASQGCRQLDLQEILPCTVLWFYVLSHLFSSFPAVPRCLKLKVVAAKIHGSTRLITSFTIVLPRVEIGRAPCRET